MTRNYNEYEIVIDLEQYSLDSLDDKPPPLEPISLTPVEYPTEPIVSAGLIDQSQLDAGVALRWHQDTPFLDNFYETAEETLARRNRRRRSSAEREKKEPLHVESRKSTTVGLDNGQRDNDVDVTDKVADDLDALDNDRNPHEAAENAKTRDESRSTEQRNTEEDAAASFVGGGDDDEDDEDLLLAETKDQEPDEKTDPKNHHHDCDHDNHGKNPDQHQPSTTTNNDNKPIPEEPQPQPQPQPPSDDQKDIRKSCTNVFIDRKHILRAFCRRHHHHRSSTDGITTTTTTETPDQLNMNNYISFTGESLQWGGGGGFLRHARRCSGNAESIQVQARVGRRWKVLVLDDVYQHVWNDNGVLRFSLEPLGF